ncbi:linear amide C-N hydrolase [Candidatus Pacearchaeota archaeon]|nr:linear amide C-N hydrolase [Candidatus Pacearchaeota archaeon]
MKKLETEKFQGNHYEIGKQQGKIYKKRGMNLKTMKINYEDYQKQLAIYKKHYPEMLDELRGVAEGLDEDEERVMGWFITNELSWIKKLFDKGKSCTIFSYKIGKKLYVGRNYDWLPETERVFEIYKYHLKEGNSFVAVTDGAYGGEAGSKNNNLYYNPDDAINDKGLFIGLTFAYSNNWNYGLQCIHFTKLIAETCETVEEAIKIFKKVPACSPKNYFIADRYGDSVIVEHTSKKFRILRPKKGVLIQSNHYVDEELAKQDMVLERVPYHNTFIRYFETLQSINLAKKNFNFNDLSKVMTRNGSYTCQNFPGIRTIWSLSPDMTKKNYKMHYDLFGKRKTIKLSI